MLLRAMLAGTMLASAIQPVATVPGFVYRFQSGFRTGTVSASTAGTVWVSGNDARQEVESKQGRISISIAKERGKQILVLNTTEHTYHHAVAFRFGSGLSVSSLDLLNVRQPFVLAGVKNLKVDLVPVVQEGHTQRNPDNCQRVSLKLSYDLRLRLTIAPELFAGRVEGEGEYCLADSLPIASLPFGHGLELSSGIPEVDSVLTERLATLKGLPVTRTLTVTRKIEGGETVSQTSTLALSDFRDVEIPKDRFEVPADYRYQEPVIVPPKRQVP
jgi:hypothetical protein